MLKNIQTSWLGAAVALLAVADIALFQARLANSDMPTAAQRAHERELCLNELKADLYIELKRARSVTEVNRANPNLSAVTRVTADQRRLEEATPVIACDEGSVSPDVAQQWRQMIQTGWAHKASHNSTGGLCVSYVEKAMSDLPVDLPGVPHSSNSTCRSKVDLMVSAYGTLGF